jgi:predicted  nucleic acid-binding Zn-ribbon protein
MIKKIKELLEVQEIDLKIILLSQEKEILPQELERFKEDVKTREAGKKAMEEENQNLIKARRQKELDLESKNETRKKFQGQLYQLKSNKEYTALLQEIDGVKKELDTIEEEILMLMEKIEDSQLRIAEDNKLLEESRKKADEASKENEKKLSRIDAELKQRQKEREEKSSHIPQELLNRYERVRRGRNGIGIVAIKNDACQGCFMELPPQVISETKLGQRLITCENCNRLLYLE